MHTYEQIIIELYKMKSHYSYSSTPFGVSEPVNELGIRPDKLDSQALYASAVKHNCFIVGSVDSSGHPSFASTPTVHTSSQSARTECARLAKLTPGRLYIFVKITGGELVPVTSTISI